ncbi:MAG TPA: sialidase family protein [Casimicrobiaceae bacterium]|nr:sialidase family protein [Casimicrobiaceae bacterium]
MPIPRTPVEAALPRPARRGIASGLFAAFAAAFASPAFGYTVVEYYNASLDHYFMTPLPAEIGALDAGRIEGWMRTGFVFDAYASAAAAGGASVSPVCRFYIPPQHGDSHFFSASPDECRAVLAKIGTDPDFSGYVYETPAAFYIALPDTASGACPSGTLPVYRLWNHRADSNHRYTADLATRNAMIMRGYVPEGYGTMGVAMCTPRAAVSDSQVRVTAASPFAPGCDGAPATGVPYPGAEVEPMIAIDPQDPSRMIGVFQQDRWSDGGARGLRTGYSFDGGLSWSLTQASFSHCTGGSRADYARASDPWATIGPDGIAYQIAIAFNGATFAAGSASAVLASRSTDGGRSWSAPATLIADGSAYFNDKESITADVRTPGTAYAVWDRLTPNGHGPTYLSRTTDGGLTWEPARPIYDPGGRNQTLNNQIVVATSGAGRADGVFDFFTEVDVAANATLTTHLAVVRSADGGATWSPAMRIADTHAVGTRDPQNPARTLRDAANLGAFAAGPGAQLVAVWQDARFSGGAIDGIAFSRSRDGGATWSAPVQVNRVPGVQAFLPSVTVRNDGTIGVLYYDMRSDTPDPNTLLVDVWLATSTDGVAWSEVHVAGPFDFDSAPVAEGGLFVGDYQGVASASGSFTAFYARTNPDPTNRTDIFASGFRSIGTGAKQQLATKAGYRARAAAPLALTPELQQRLAASIARTLAGRRNGPPPRGVR